jgi:hypothetical protein
MSSLLIASADTRLVAPGGRRHRPLEGSRGQSRSPVGGRGRRRCGRRGDRSAVRWPGGASGSDRKAAAAERFAGTIISAFDVCEQVGAPLTQAQKVALLEAALLEFDGLEAQLNSLVAIGELLRGDDAGRPR